MQVRLLPLQVPQSVQFDIMLGRHYYFIMLLAFSRFLRKIQAIFQIFRQSTIVACGFSKKREKALLTLRFVCCGLFDKNGYVFLLKKKSKKYPVSSKITFSLEVNWLFDPVCHID